VRSNYYSIKNLMDQLDRLLLREITSYLSLSDCINLCRSSKYLRTGILALDLSFVFTTRLPKYDIAILEHVPYTGRIDLYGRKNGVFVAVPGFPFYSTRGEVTFSRGVLHGDATLTMMSYVQNCTVQRTTFVHGEKVKNRVDVEAAYSIESNYAGSKRHGLQTFTEYGPKFRPSIMYTNYKHGIEHGEFSKCRLDGTVIYHGYKCDGQLEGEYSEYTDRQVRIKHVFYRDHREHGPCKYYHDNGQLWLDYYSECGRIIGPYCRYYRHGQLKQYSVYVDGKRIKSSIHKWSKTGQPLWP